MYRSPRAPAFVEVNDFCLQHLSRGRLTSVRYFESERSLSHIKGGIPINLFPYAAANINSSFLFPVLFSTVFHIHAGSSMGIKLGQNAQNSLLNIFFFPF